MFNQFYIYYLSCGLNLYASSFIDMRENNCPHRIQESILKFCSKNGLGSDNVVKNLKLVCNMFTYYFILDTLMLIYSYL